MSKQISVISRYFNSISKGAFILYGQIKVEFQDKIKCYLWPTNDNPQFMWSVIANGFPPLFINKRIENFLAILFRPSNAGVEKNVMDLCTTKSVIPSQNLSAVIAILTISLRKNYASLRLPCLSCKG